MQQRITKKDIEPVVTRLNTFSPVTGRTYHLNCAYGGYALHDDQNRDVLYSGYVPARELLSLMFAFIEGYYAAAGGDNA